jgi:BirA family biotin operon repressor/biotin-[acetyl-CoA-carboxylase] ligase
MEKKMLDLLSSNREDLSNTALNEILKGGEKEIAKAVKETGLQGTDYINKTKLENNLKTKYIGNEILAFKEVESTNSVAEFLAENGSGEGTVVLSELQSQGRGRYGRKWESPRGGTWLSIILKPNMIPSKAPFITLATGVAVAKTLKNFGVDGRIKWPNDILIDGKKVCGILTEASVRKNEVVYVIVGVGIDSNLNIEILNKKIKKKTTSLKNELKKEINETKLISKFLNEFEKVYDLFKEEKIRDILDDWLNMSETIGSYVEIKQPAGKLLKGCVVGITGEGALILEENDGNMREVISGECIIKKRN